MLTSCKVAPPAQSGNPTAVDPAAEPRAPRGFVKNVQDLTSSHAYRQNIWLAWGAQRDEVSAALCMDLRNQPYLVVSASGVAARIVNLPARYRQRALSAPEWAKRMHPNAFLPGIHPPQDTAIFDIPSNAGESFAADILNGLLELNLGPGEFFYQYD